MTQVITLDPSDFRAYWDRGLAKAHLGDYTGMFTDLVKAIMIKLNLAWKGS